MDAANGITSNQIAKNICMLKATSAEICKLKVLKNAAIKTQWHALHLFGKVQIEILAYFSNLLHDEHR